MCTRIVNYFIKNEKQRTQKSIIPARGIPRWVSRTIFLTRDVPYPVYDLGDVNADSSLGVIMWNIGCVFLSGNTPDSDCDTTGAVQVGSGNLEFRLVITETDKQTPTPGSKYIYSSGIITIKQPAIPSAASLHQETDIYAGAIKFNLFD